MIRNYCHPHYVTSQMPPPPTYAPPRITTKTLDLGPEEKNESGDFYLTSPDGLSIKVDNYSFKHPVSISVNHKNLQDNFFSEDTYQLDNLTGGETIIGKFSRPGVYRVTLSCRTGSGKDCYAQASISGPMY